MGCKGGPKYDSSLLYFKRKERRSTWHKPKELKEEERKGSEVKMGFMTSEGAIELTTETPLASPALEKTQTIITAITSPSGSKDKKKPVLKHVATIGPV